MRFVAVAIAGFVLGGWAVPLGFVLRIGAPGVFLAAAGGGLAGCWAFILIGDRFAAWVHDRRDRRRTGPEPAPTEMDEQAAADMGRVRRFVERYGVRGLGLVGPIFPGVTASVAGGLALGVDRHELGRWMTVGIVTMYGLYTVGLWLLVRVL